MSDERTVTATPVGLDRDALRAETLAVLPEWASEDRILIMGIRGSHAHGTYIPPEHDHGTDDVDVFVVTAQEPDWYLGLESYNPQRKTGQHFETHGERLDIVVYDVRKLGFLLVKGNPNVHSMLWSPPDCYLIRSPAALGLFKARSEFISQRTLKATAGYAHAQLHRMTHFQRNGYMGAKRKALVKRHSFDTKNAAHCIRLLWQGIGVAQSGRVKVRWEGHEAQRLRDIKTGKYTLGKVKDLAEREFKLFNACRENTDLPKTPDREACSAVIARAIRALAGREE